MAKRSKKTQVEPVEVAPIVEAPSFVEPEAPALIRRTVVPPSYKALYASRAIANGRNTKAAKRANGDWLALELEAECVTKKGFDFERFMAILSSNGVDPTRWASRTAGWQGRVRMSGSIVLRGVVRKSGVLVTPEGALIDAPESFTAQG